MNLTIRKFFGAVGRAYYLTALFLSIGFLITTLNNPFSMANFVFSLAIIPMAILFHRIVFWVIFGK